MYAQEEVPPGFDDFIQEADIFNGITTGGNEPSCVSDSYKNLNPFTIESSCALRADAVANEDFSVTSSEERLIHEDEPVGGMDDGGV